MKSLLINDSGRVCTKCNKFKSWDNFCKAKGRTRDHESTCKSCNHKKYIENKKYKLEKQKKYYCDHIEERREYNKKYTLENRDKIIEAGKRRYQKKKESIKRHAKKYYKENKDFVLYYKTEIPTKYNLWVDRLTIEEDPREDEYGFLEVRCSHCKKYFKPSYRETYDRYNALNEDGGRENRLYCSQECKEQCGVYKQVTSFKTKVYTSKYKDARSKEWGDIVIRRDNYTCQECGSKEDLVAHHIIPVAEDYMQSADIDNGICLCRDCHTKKHRNISGCSYSDLRSVCN